ncbi:MAG: hypothetical protein EPN82_05435 [Bacteroidetes bacterium]|nr:MAG: hypothetical protein EPN82_05435 [Bacteroidota bacterium]
MKFITLFIAGLLFLNIITFSHDKSEFWDEYFEPDSLAALSNEYPTIELDYGMGIPRFKNDYIDKNFTDISVAELKLGFTKKRVDLYNQFAMSYKFTYFLIGTITSDWTSEDKIGDNLNSNVWRLGLGMSRGYGYNISEGTYFVLFNSGNIFWSKVEFKDKDAATSITKDILKTYDNGNFRFCQSYESGFKFQMFYPLSIGASYEKIIVYPRLMTWYWLGSQILTGIGQSTIEYFTHKVAKASPGAGSIVHFILINAYNYGAYELRKKYMNWPYQTASPLMYDNWKVGLTFAF